MQRNHQDDQANDQKDEGNIESKRQEAARNVVAKYGDAVREDKNFASMIDKELDAMQGDNDYAKGTGTTPDHIPQPKPEEPESTPNTTPYEGTTASTSGPAKASTQKKQANN